MPEQPTRQARRGALELKGRAQGQLGMGSSGRAALREAEGGGGLRGLRVLMGAEDRRGGRGGVLCLGIWRALSPPPRPTLGPPL